MSEDGTDIEAGQGGDAGNSSSQEKTVPLSALQAERRGRQALERDLAELKGTVNTLKQTQTQPKEHSKAELQTAVDAGQISQEGADRLWDEQRDRKLKAEVKAEVVTETQAQDRARKIQSEIDRYKEFRPGIMDETSEDRQLVAAEYTRQVTDLGKPQDLQTELDALTATFGPSHRLQKGQERQAETHQEVGSDAGSSKAAGKKPKLPAHVTEHYEKLIGMGHYPKGWDDPKLKQEIGDFGRWG